jgi:SAM-dependent methyltransferase
MEAVGLNKPVGSRSESAGRPIFIVGCPRSGTTLLQCLIATQKGVVTFPETHFFEQVANNVPENRDGSINLEMAIPAFERAAREMGMEIQDPTKRLRSSTLADSNKKTLLLELLKANLRARSLPVDLSTCRWVEKTPYHVFHIPEILTLFPEAKIICVLRHPAAVVLSCESKVTTNSAGPGYRFTHTWINCLKAFETNQKDYPNSLYLVKYEDLVADVVAMMRKISAFTDIPLEVDRLTEHHNQAWQCCLPWEKWKERNKEEAVRDTNQEHKTWRNLSVILRVQYLTRRERERYGYRSWFPLVQSVYDFAAYLTRPARRLRRSILSSERKTGRPQLTEDSLFFAPAGANSIERVEAVAKEIRPLVGNLDSWYTRYVSDHRGRIALDVELIESRFTRNQRIIDVGCIPLLLLGTLCRSGFSAEGIDIHPARFSAAVGKLNLSVHRCDIERERLPLADSCIDGIIFNEIFEHLRVNPIFTIGELKRVLKPGGLLILSTPNLTSLHGLINIVFRNRAHSCSGNIYDEYSKLETLGHMGHVREYTVTEVAEFLTRFGFQIRQIAYRGTYAKSLWKNSLTRCFPKLAPFFTIIAVKT